MKTPRQVEIAITNHCNLRCKYCYHFSDEENFGKDLPKEEWLKFFTELKQCNVMKVTLEGGEPFFRKDLKEILSGIVKNNMRYEILTNGTLIEEDIASFIASTKRCDLVQVSIDGSNPEIHDSVRGKGSFIKAIEGIKNLKKSGVPIIPRVTINKKNIDDLDNIAKLLLEDLGLSSFSTNEAAYMGLCKKNSEEVKLTVQEFSFAISKILMLNKKYKNRITAIGGPLSKGRKWIEMRRASDEKRTIINRGHLAACGCSMYKIAVTADGVMVPCLQLSHIKLGRINKDDLKEIWLNSPEFNKIRERNQIPLSRFEFCRGCDYINNCTDGCPAISYHSLGEIYHPTPSGCLKQYLEKGGKLPEKLE